MGQCRALDANTGETNAQPFDFVWYRGFRATHPVAVDDSVSGNEGATSAFMAPCVLSNDSDVDGDTLTASLVSGPSHAVSFTLNADGGFSYRHDGSETTSDSFVYRASDGHGGFADATVSITINPVNDAPVNAVPGGQTTSEDTDLIFTAGNGNLLSISDADAGSNPVQVTLTGTSGVLTLSGTAGLAFMAGDGTADGTTTFQGTLADINAALAGLRFTPTPDYNGGGASLQIVTNDLGNSGSGGADGLRHHPDFRDRRQ